MSCYLTTSFTTFYINRKVEISQGPFSDVLKKPITAANDVVENIGDGITKAVRRLSIEIVKLQQNRDDGPHSEGADTTQHESEDSEIREHQQNAAEDRVNIANRKVVV